MTKQDYIDARARHALSVSQWIDKLGISRSAHDSFVTGRRSVPRYIAAHIQSLDEIARVLEFENNLKNLNTTLERFNESVEEIKQIEEKALATAS